MNTKSMCLFGGALLSAGLTSNALADVMISDELDFRSVGFTGSYGYLNYTHGTLEIDTIDFEVNISGYITIDVLSFKIFDRYANTRVFLFTNDGNVPSYDNFLASSGSGDLFDDQNGSVSSSDPILETYLSAGTYTLAIAGGYTSTYEVGNGFSKTSNPVYSDVGADTELGAQYQIDIYGDVSIVPAPGSLALLGLGGIACGRRRR